MLLDIQNIDIHVQFILDIKTLNPNSNIRYLNEFFCLVDVQMIDIKIIKRYLNEQNSVWISRF